MIAARIKKCLRAAVHRVLFGIVKATAGAGYADRSLPVPVLFRCWLMQKVFRVNANVPWPVHWTSQVRRADRVKKGSRNPGISMGCYMDGRNGIEIGENTWIGPGAAIISMNHDVNDYSKYNNEGPIEIGRDCWIGAHAIILPGVILGQHTVVAAGAVVSKSFPEGDQLLAGVPARVVKRLGPYQGQKA